MIDLEQRDAVAILRMQHGKANALDLEFCRELEAQFEALARSSTEAVVLVGQGKIFSAGVDLVRLLDEGAPYTEKFLPALGDAFGAIFRFPKPLVAAVNGHAVAGGCILACAADRRLMARGSGRIGVPELLVGVPFPVAALEIMRFAVPQRYFSEAIYGGATYTPDDAFERGLVDELVDPEALLDCALEAAQKLAALGSANFALTKAQIRKPAFERIGAGLEADPAVKEIWTSPSTQQSVRDFVSKTFKRG